MRYVLGVTNRLPRPQPHQQRRHKGPAERQVGLNDSQAPLAQLLAALMQPGFGQRLDAWLVDGQQPLPGHDLKRQEQQPHDQRGHAPDLFDGVPGAETQNGPQRQPRQRGQQYVLQVLGGGRCR